MNKNLIIHVFGRVQGVFFRQSAQKKAEELALSGLVRNEPDGSVYIAVEGEESKLTEFQQWCKQGPPMATVNKLEVSEGTWQGFNGFVIQRGS